MNELLCYFDSNSGRCKCGAKDGEAQTCKFYLPDNPSGRCANLVPGDSVADCYCGNTYACFEGYILALKSKQEDTENG